MVLALFIFFVTLALSIPLTVGQYRLDEANDRLEQADVRVCEQRRNVVEEHNQLARTMADLERKDASHSTAQREQIAQAWEESLLEPVTGC